MIRDLHKFATSEPRRFKIPDLHRFATSGLRRFKIPDLHKFVTSSFAGSRFPIFIESTTLKTYFMNFVKPDVSRVADFS
jgi:hypothetical protein